MASGGEKWGRFGGSSAAPSPAASQRVLSPGAMIVPVSLGSTPSQSVKNGVANAISPRSGFRGTPGPSPKAGYRATSPPAVVNQFSRPQANGAPPAGSRMAYQMATPQAQQAPVDPQQGEAEQQVAAWDYEMDSLDKKQEQLLNDQWRLLRTQIGSLMGALSEVRAELADLKTNVVTKEMEAVVEQMVNAHDGHDKNHSSIIDRLTYLEESMGESVDNHAANHVHKTGMDERLEYLETFLGESAEKHAADLAAHRDAHAEHKTTMEARLEYLEGLLGDSADKHAEMEDALSKCAQTAHHAGLDERVQYLEGFLGESADKHANDIANHKKGWEDHKTTMETRLEFLEGLLGDSSDKHAKEIEAAHGKLADLHAAITSCAKVDHHASLEQRMEYLEKFLGESADLHEQNAAAHKDHKTTMEQRLEYIEAMLGDSSDKHSQELEAAKGKLGSMEDALKLCAKHDHASSLEDRVDYLEKSSGESVDNHSMHKTTMEQRLEFIEGMLGDSAEKHSKELGATKMAHAAHKTATEMRLDKIENGLASTVATTANKVNELETSLKSSVEKRLNVIETKHVTDLIEHKSTYEVQKTIMETRISETETKHLAIVSEIKKCSSQENHAVMDRRMASIEDKHKQSLESSLSDFKELQRNFEDKVTRTEMNFVETSENNARRINTLEAGHMKLKNSIDEVGGMLRDERSARITGFESNETRVGNLESLAQESNRHFTDLEIMSGKVREMVGKVDAQKSMYDGNKANTEQRLAYIEGTMVDGGMGGEFVKEMDQRIHYMQEDAKRARDILESSIKEQLRLEHGAVNAQSEQIKEQWDREARARQAYMESYKELLQQERVARDVACNQLSERLQYLENKPMTPMMMEPIMVSAPPQPTIMLEPIIMAPEPIVISGPQPTIIAPPTTMERAAFMSSGQLSPRVPLQSVSHMGPMGTTSFQSAGAVSPSPSIARMASVGTMHGIPPTGQRAPMGLNIDTRF